MLLDSDLAALYGVPVKRLNEQTSRNRSRFPEDFMFQLSPEEAAGLRSQTATLKRGQHRKYRPYAFTEQGVARYDAQFRAIFEAIRELMVPPEKARRRIGYEVG